MNDDWLETRARRLLLVLGAGCALVAIILWCLWKADTNVVAQHRAQQAASAAANLGPTDAAISPDISSPGTVPLSTASPGNSGD